MEQTSNQRVFAVVSNKGHDIKIVLRAMELALCNAVLDETSKFVVIGDVGHGTVRTVVQEVARRNKIEAPDDIFGFYKDGGDNAEFAKRKILTFNPAGCDTVTKKINSFLRMNDAILKRRFCHIFSDELIITNAWNPLMIETMMDDISIPFYCDPKINSQNTVFGKLSPVKTFVYAKKVGEVQVMPYPVVCYCHDDDGYIVVDTAEKQWKDRSLMFLDENVRRKFVPVQLQRLLEADVIPSYDYLPDPFLNMTVTKNPLFKNMSDEDKKVLLADLTADRPVIDELNKKRADNDFERWPDVQKRISDACDRMELELLKNGEQKNG